MRDNLGGEAFSAINITPFTDVLLVLLIIFLIAGSSLSLSGLGLEQVTLEGEVTSATALEQPGRLILDASGTLWLEREGGHRERARLDRLDPNREWEFTAAGETPMQTVVEVYDDLLRRGFSKLSLSPWVSSV